MIQRANTEIILEENDISEYDRNIIASRIYLKLLLYHKATPKFIEKVEEKIKYFEDIGEYEKCRDLQKYLKYNKEIYVN